MVPILTCVLVHVCKFFFLCCFQMFSHAFCGCSAFTSLMSLIHFIIHFPFISQKLITLSCYRFHMLFLRSGFLLPLHAVLLFPNLTTIVQSLVSNLKKWLIQSFKFSVFFLVKVYKFCSGIRNSPMLMMWYLWVRSMAMEWRMWSIGFFQNFLRGLLTILKYVTLI